MQMLHTEFFFEFPEKKSLTGYPSLRNMERRVKEPTPERLYFSFVPIRSRLTLLHRLVLLDPSSVTCIRAPAPRLLLWPCVNGTRWLLDLSQSMNSRLNSYFPWNRQRKGAIYYSTSARFVEDKCWGHQRVERSDGSFPLAASFNRQMYVRVHRFLYTSA